MVKSWNYQRHKAKDLIIYSCSTRLFDIFRGLVSLPNKATIAHSIRRFAGWSFAATIVAIPLRYRFNIADRSSPPIYQDYTYILLFLSDLFLLSTLIFWGLYLALQSKRLVRGPLFLTIPIALFIVFGFTSLVKSVDVPITLYHTVRLSLLGLFYFYILNEFKSLTYITIPVALQLLIQSSIGIAQNLQQGSLGLGFLGEYDLDPSWPGVSIVFANGIRSLRAYGLTDHPNILGGCLAFSLLLIAVEYLKSSRTWRPLLAAIFMIGSIGLLLSFSRSAWLAIMGGTLLAVMILHKTEQKEYLRDLVILAGSTIIVLTPFIWHQSPFLGVRLNIDNSFTRIGPEIQSMGERQILNSATNYIFSQQPLTGIGLGALPLAMRDYFPELQVDYQPAHFVLIDVAAEIGLFGAVAYSVTLLFPWIALWLGRKRLVFSLDLIGASCLLLAVTIVGFFDYYTWLLPPGRLWQWLAWGIWGAIYISSYRNTKHD